MAGGLTVNTSVERYGPVFDGRAEVAVKEFEASVTREAAAIGRDWIRIAAMAMDKSGRGGSGEAADGVVLNPVPGGWQIYGSMIKGRVWWPWLEGVSRRNASSKFKGYHTFRTTKFKLSRSIPAIAEMKLAEYLPEMGGEAL
jgi:hypothetical protein